MADTSLGNFKGVMLCNRPTQIQGSLQAAVNSIVGPTRPAFISSVVPETALGLPPVAKSRLVRIEHKNAADDVTYRHKKWLASFQERRAQIMDVMEKKAQRMMENKQRFAERNQRVRDAIRQVKQHDPNDKEALNEALATGRVPHWLPTEYQDYSQNASTLQQTQQQQHHQQQQQSQQQQPQQQQQQIPHTPQYQSFDETPNASSSKPKSSRSSKPAWSRSAAEQEAEEEKEAEDLIDFAANLDYDNYIDDMEVREALRFVQDRVTTLEKQQKQDELATARRVATPVDDDYEEITEIDPTAEPGPDGQPVMRTIRRKKWKPHVMPVQEHEQKPEWDTSTANNMRPSSSSQHDKLEATRVLDSSRAMRSVHSSASVRAMMDRERHSAAAMAGRAALGYNALDSNGSVSEHSLAVRPPLIAVTHERLPITSKIDPSNLPFLYRNPAI